MGDELMKALNNVKIFSNNLSIFSLWISSVWGESNASFNRFLSVTGAVFDGV